ncbi:EcsC family protein [Bdellovibrio sp. HCB337]|uniref:EcsC family protein n=1 Tax=Bdellovibrio sp. HCB337 TaxID=3394358 RepID=UPI0039A57B13
MENISDREKEFVYTAAQFLENPGFLIKAANALGKPLELMQNSLPPMIRRKISETAENALRKTLDISISTVAPESLPKQPLLQGKKHSIATAVTGAVGGFFGPLALAVELPVTTGIIFRSIATIAQSFGEDLSDPEVRMECLQVFAMGSPQSNVDDAMNSSYFAQRLALNSFLKKASETGTASLLARFLARVAARYEIVVAEKVMAEAIPVLGAAGGAAINVAFTNFFNNTAYYHFGLRRLERKYGADLVQKLYLESLK